MVSEKPSAGHIQSPKLTEIKDCADLLGKTVQPDWVKTCDEPAHGGHKGGGLTSVRTVEHKGRKIFIKTTYQIEVDGQSYKGHAQVNSEGRIHCHAIPYDSFPSAVDFVKQLIDLYPESFPGYGKEKTV